MCGRCAAILTSYGPLGIRSRRARALLVTASAPVRSCRHCCSMTRRPSRSPSVFAPRPRHDRRDRGNLVARLGKAGTGTPLRLRHRVNLLHSVTVSVPATGPTVDPETLTAVAAAIRDHLRLRFDYRSHDGTTSLRTAEPHKLVHSGRRWYLIAWDIDRSGWRTYRLDRLEPRVPTGPRFTPRETPDANLAEYLTEGTTSRVYRYQARSRCMFRSRSRPSESLRLSARSRHRTHKAAFCIPVQTPSRTRDSRCAVWLPLHRSRATRVDCPNPRARRSNGQGSLGESPL